MWGAVVVYCGFAVAGVGLVSILMRMTRSRSASRGHGVVALAAGVALAAVGLVLPASESKVARLDSQLDRFAPIWQFRERHQLEVPAPPERVFAAILRVRADEIFLFRALTWVRRGGRSIPRGILNPERREPLIDEAVRGGFVRLATDAPRELVLGKVLFAPAGARLPTTPEDFAAPVPPGFTIATINFRVLPARAGGSLVTTETRVFANGPAVRRSFAAYWRVIYPGSAIIRRMWLRAIRRRAAAPPAALGADRNRGGPASERIVIGSLDPGGRPGPPGRARAAGSFPPGSASKARRAEWRPGSVASAWPTSHARKRRSIVMPKPLVRPVPSCSACAGESGMRATSSFCSRSPTRKRPGRSPAMPRPEKRPLPPV